MPRAGRLPWWGQTPVSRSRGLHPRPPPPGAPRVRRPRDRRSQRSRAARRPRDPADPSSGTVPAVQARGYPPGRRVRRDARGWTFVRVRGQSRVRVPRYQREEPSLLQPIGVCGLFGPSDQIMATTHSAESSGRGPTRLRSGCRCAARPARRAGLWTASRSVAASLHDAASVPRTRPRRGPRSGWGWG